jgi:GntR family carbon starvation induced transcriptional regulator
MEGPPRSQSTAAYVRLKRDLLEGVRAPGAKLKINEIAQEVGVSPGAVREALSRLAPEGLVVFRDQRGFVVAPLSIEDLDDLTRLRCDIEGLALRRSLVQGDASWEASVLAAAHRLRRTPKWSADGGASSTWRTLHDRFHTALVGACGSLRLLDVRAQLHQQSERYRMLSALVDDERDVDGEHQSLVDAALDRNVEEVVRQANSHFQKTTSLIKAAFTMGSAPRLELVASEKRSRSETP